MKEFKNLSGQSKEKELIQTVMYSPTLPSHSLLHQFLFEELRKFMLWELIWLVGFLHVLDTEPDISDEPNVWSATFPSAYIQLPQVIDKYVKLDKPQDRPMCTHYWPPA
ncbi:hypothetical protein GRJ2_000210700 [Grus japonensis]|uniref:Uncharacterized protein n=1 Tax=Grus japonensis TaxID=30415 RepID=A0ABC9VW45_GRUJA